MRAGRLVQLLLVLQSRGPRTAAALAAELEVSVRTIYRDVESLSAAGVPIYAESGPGGGIRLVDGYQTRLTGMTANEAGALAFAGTPALADQLGLASVLVAAQTKVDAALPPELRSRSIRVRERFLVDAPGWFRRQAGTPHLGPLAEAVWDARAVRVRYGRAGKVVDRRLRPLGLVVKAGTWYVLAAAGRGDDVRTYRVDRIASLRLEQPFQRPSGFDLATAWQASQRSFAEDLLTFTATARVPADRLRLLRWALVEAAAEEAIAGAREPDMDGWCEVTIRSESMDVAHDELLRMGGAIEVLQPPELRRRLARTGAALASHNH